MNQRTGHLDIRGEARGPQAHRGPTRSQAASASSTLGAAAGVGLSAEAGLPRAQRPRTQGGTPHGDPWLLPDYFGKAVHEVVADLAAIRAHRRRSQIVPMVSQALDRRATAGPALRRRLTGLATTYADLFAPPQQVHLLGAEVALADARFDLLWTTGTHQWADEIKSAGDRLTEQLARQCERQLRAGSAEWGAAFVGVRVLWLQTPGRELLISSCSTVRA